MARGRKPSAAEDKKRYVSTYLDPEVDAYIRTIAKREDISVSEVVNTLLRHAMMHQDEQKWWEYLGPRIERKIEQTVATMSNRLSHLLARTALEATAGREMQRTVIAAQAIDKTKDREQATEYANAVREQAWRFAVRDLKKPSAGVREILGLAPQNQPGNQP